MICVYCGRETGDVFDECAGCIDNALVLAVESPVSVGSAFRKFVGDMFAIIAIILYVLALPLFIGVSTYIMHNGRLPWW